MDRLLAATCLGVSGAMLAFLCFLIMVRIARRLQSPEIHEEVKIEERFWEGNSWRPLLPLIRVTAKFYERYDQTRMARRTYDKLIVLGNPLHMRAADFLAISQLVAMALGGFAALVGLSAVISLGISLGAPFILALFGAGIGIAIPRFYLNSEADRRLRAINNDLPYAMDFMLLMIQGGATIQEAFTAVTREGSFGPLGEEFSLVNREIQHGSVLSHALTNLAQRIPSDDLAVIVQAVNQGLLMGTPIANILKDQSDLLRLKRSQNAEEIAKKAGSKMTFPIILIMAATFLMILGPAAMYIMKMQSQQ